MAGESMLSFEIMLGEARRGVNAKTAELEAARRELARRREAVEALRRSAARVTQQQEPLDRAVQQLQEEVVKEACAFEALSARHRHLDDTVAGLESTAAAAARDTYARLASLQQAIRLRLADAAAAEARDLGT